MTDAMVRYEATVASAMLRDATLRFMGVEVKPAPRPERPKKRQPNLKLVPLEPRPPCEREMLVADIQRGVADYYGLHPNAMLSTRRMWAYERQIAMFLASELTTKSLVQIGRQFSRDHTTVIHAIKAVQHRIATNPDTAREVNTLRGKLARVAA